MVARRAHNPKVTGSSPVPATQKVSLRRDFFLCLYVLCLLMRFKIELFAKLSGVLLLLFALAGIFSFEIEAFLTIPFSLLL